MAGRLYERNCHAHSTCYYVGVANECTLPPLPTSRSEFYLTWCCHLFNAHGRYINDNPTKFMTVLRAVQKAVMRQQELIGRLCDDNRYSLAFLHQIAGYARTDTLGSIELATTSAE